MPKVTQINGFHLTEHHIEAIQAQINLIAMEGGYGEVRLVLERGRIARLQTTTSLTVHDEPEHTTQEFRKTASERRADR
jgi:hypothetical protein